MKMLWVCVRACSHCTWELFRMIGSKLKRLVEGAMGTTVSYATKTKKFSFFSAYYKHIYIEYAQT